MTQITHNVFGSVGSVKEEVKENPLNDLRSLVELGAIVDEVSIGGMKFTLKTPPMLERVRLAEQLKSIENPTEKDLVDFQINVLGIVVQTANGKPLEGLHPDQTMEPLKRKVDIIATFQSPVINALIRKYQEIIARCDSQYDIDTIKK